LSNSEVYCHVHNSSLLAPVLSQINPVHAFTAHFLNIYHIIILTSIPRFSKCPLSFHFPHETPVRTLLFPLRLLPPGVFDMPPTHPILLTVYIWVPVLVTIVYARGNSTSPHEAFHLRTCSCCALKQS